MPGPSLYSFMLKPKGIEPERYMLVNQANALIHLVRSGLGIAFVPRFSIAGMVERGELKTSMVKGVPLEWKWYTAHADREPVSHFATAFISMVQDLFSSKAISSPPLPR